MRMTRRRRKRAGLAKDVWAVDSPPRLTRLHRREMRLKKWRQVRLRQVSALVSMGTFCLMNLPFQRVSAADVLHPVSQAHADLREVESESRRSHMKHQLEKQKAANARACQVADMRLHQAEVHLANCQAELRVYAETSLKSRIVEEHRQRWQAECERAQEERDAAEITWTDCQVEALEIEKKLAGLSRSEGLSIRTGITYVSWSSSSGSYDGHQVILPLQADYQKDSLSVKVKSGLFAQSQDVKLNIQNITGMMDTDIEASWREEHGHRDVDYLLGLHLPTGKKMEVAEFPPAGWCEALPLSKGWGISPGLSVSRHYTPDDVLTVKGSVSWDGAYDASDDRKWGAGRIRPGQSYQQVVTYLHRGLGANYMLRFFHEAEETSRIGPYDYRPGEKSTLAFYADHYVSECDAWQAYAMTFRQYPGYYGMSAETDGRYSGNLYGLGWRHEMNPGREAFLRFEYMTMGGRCVDPVRSQVQENVRRLSGSLGWRQCLAQDVDLEGSLTCYRQEDDICGRMNGWRTDLMLQKHF